MLWALEFLESAYRSLGFTRNARQQFGLYERQANKRESV